jgi:hypothetical protein
MTKQACTMGACSIRPKFADSSSFEIKLTKVSFISGSTSMPIQTPAQQTKLRGPECVTTIALGAGFFLSMVLGL